MQIYLDISKIWLSLAYIRLRSSQFIRVVGYTCVVRNSIILSLIYSQGVHLSQNPYQSPLSHLFYQEKGEVSIWSDNGAVWLSPAINPPDSFPMKRQNFHPPVQFISSSTLSFSHLWSGVTMRRENTEKYMCMCVNTGEAGGSAVIREFCLRRPFTSNICLPYENLTQSPPSWKQPNTKFHFSQ